MRVIRGVSGENLWEIIINHNLAAFDVKLWILYRFFQPRLDLNR